MEPNLTEIFGSYMSWKTTEDTWIINAMDGTQNMYLLEGNDRALLIDTLYGAGNLRAHVESLTDKPVTVINTHGHLDHSGGNGEWDEVLMLEGAIPDVETCYRCPFDISKLPHPEYKKTVVREGDVIDLGGRTLEIYDITAHSNGSLALLDRAGRQLFVGDELESRQVLMFEVEEARRIEGRPAFVLKDRLLRHYANTKKLLALREHWDAVYPAHNGAPIAPSYVEDYAALTEHIFAGDAVIEDQLNHKYIERDNPNHGLCRVRWNKASFFVKKADLMEIWGSRAL